MPIDYQNGKVYVIRNHINDKVYVGSTCQELSQRMTDHRKNTRRANVKHIKLYLTMNELGVDNFYIELYKFNPCSCISELHKAEGEAIRILNSVNDGYNARVAGRSPKEACKAYYDRNREKRVLLSRECREKNRQIKPNFLAEQAMKQRLYRAKRKAERETSQ